MARLSPAYRPRCPEQTVLHRVLREHLGAFEAKVAAAGRQVPWFVWSELEGFLACGDLHRGFAVVRCSRCGFERRVGLSCGGRGLCPSCTGRRMAETAAHWVDSIIPRVPVRHWVLSFPSSLRFVLAYDAEATTAALGVFIREVFRWLRAKAKGELGLSSVREAHPGAVTVIQRSGSALNLNPHIHTLALDGVYVLEDGAPRFHALPAPDKYDLADIGWSVCLGTQRVLRAMGKDSRPSGGRGGVGGAVAR
jgi:hypothetical protein